MQVRNILIFSGMLFSGAFILLSKEPLVSGSAVFIDIPKSGFLGAMLLLVAVIFFVLRLDEQLRAHQLSRNPYYSKRVKELFDAKYRGQDAFVTRWELDGILNHIKNAKSSSGRKVYVEHDFEHGTDAVAIHPLGKQSLPHMSVRAVDNLGRDVKRHLLVIDDPYDPRLKTVGIDTDTGKRVPSKAYTPNHDRSAPQTYKRRINITHEF